MANYRQIHVSIWKDEWFLDLSPNEKLLFVYLFSNESASLSGIYKIALRVICFETCLPMKKVVDALDKFAIADKVHYQDGVVWVKNLRRYNRGSSKVDTRIENDLLEIPNCELKEKYIAYYDPDIPYPYPMDTISTEMKCNEMNINEFEGKGKEEENKKTGAMADLTRALNYWAILFSDKPQPRHTTKSLRDKWLTRWKDKHFRDNWRKALEVSSDSKTLQKESWFNFQFFIKNDSNYQKMVDNWMAWKDERKKSKPKVSKKTLREDGYSVPS